MDTVFYVGTEQGMFTARSRGGDAWEVVETGLGTWAVPELAVSPDGPNKVFAGTRGDGVWLSEDFGENWKKPAYNKKGPGKVSCVTVDPHNPRRIYAGCEPIDIFVSDDEGANWDRLDGIWDIPFVATVPYPVPSVEPHVRDIAIDPTNADVIYAALQVGYIVKSEDRGKTWRLLDKNLDCDVHTIVIDPVDPGRLIIATGGHDARAGKAPGRALYISEDGGDTWTPAAMNFTQEYSVPLAIDPRNPKHIFSALANGQPPRWRRPSGAESTLILTDDGGKNWRPVSKGIEPEKFPEAIAADSVTDDRVYAACRSGDFYLSDDGGESWRAMDLKLDVEDLSSITVAHA
ncbi:MAG: hypothetical protein OEO83_14645 [Alphaproteobacteria bacterium]|nr:hypothetical protein [Alphaproteobacteria bacterium]